MTSPIASRESEFSSRRASTVPVTLCIAGVLLALPEAVLARHDFGSLSMAITLGSDVAAVCAGVLLGSGLTSPVLRARTRSRRTIGFLMVLSVVLGLMGLVLANLVPPPIMTTPFLSGPFTENGALNALYIVWIIASAAAALRFAASLGVRSARRTRRRRRSDGIADS